MTEIFVFIIMQISLILSNTSTNADSFLFETLSQNGVEVYYPEDFDAMSWGRSEDEFFGFLTLFGYLDSKKVSIYNLNNNDLQRITTEAIAFSIDYNSVTGHFIGDTPLFHPEYCKGRNSLLFYSNTEFPQAGDCNNGFGYK